jgi:hypothetical protein
MKPLSELTTHRNTIWLVELAGWLHQFTKLTEGFFERQAHYSGHARNCGFHETYALGHFLEFVTREENKALLNKFESSLSVGARRDLVIDLLKKSNDRFWQKELKSSDDHSSLAGLLKTSIPAVGPWTAAHSLGFVIEAFDATTVLPLNEPHIATATTLPYLLFVAHIQASGNEKRSLQQELFETFADEKFGAGRLLDTALSAYGQKDKSKTLDSSSWRGASPFGLEIPQSRTGRQEALKLLAKVDYLLTHPRSDKHDRQAVRQELYSSLNAGIADSRRPVNDVRLGDNARMAAAFVRAAYVQGILTGVVPQNHSWRLVRLAVDGPAFVSLADRIPDLLGRRHEVERFLNQVRQCWHDDFPLGIEVYRDEHGSAFVCPSFTNEPADPSLHNYLQEALDHAKLPSPDFRYEIQISESFALGPGRGYSFQLGRLLDRPLPPVAADPAALREHWKDKNGKDIENRELCPVCALRPGPEVRRPGPQLCDVCSARRVGRAKSWLTDLRGRRTSAPPDQTIWLDEVADRHGRVALIAARLRLAGWLTGGDYSGHTQPGQEGYIARSLCLAKLPNDPEFYAQSPNAARLNRVWDATRKIWHAWQQKLPQQAGCLVHHRWRLSGQWESPPPSLANASTYLLTAQNGLWRGVKASVVWSAANESSDRGDGRGEWILNDNPQRLAAIAGQGLDVSDAWKGGTRFTVEEPTGYGAPDKLAGFWTLSAAEPDGLPYLATIPLLADPMQCFLLVPGLEAPAIVKLLRETYVEHARQVRDRLPLDVGIVWAPLATPFPAIMNAGRRLLSRKLPPELWTVSDVAPLPAGPDRKISFENGVTWTYRANTASGIPDDWYPNLLLKNGEPRHVSSIQKNDIVAVEPSTFDFEFLDVAARRFEIAYDDACRRRGPLHRRPYLLDDLDHFDRIWQYLEEYLQLGSHTARLGQVKALEALTAQKRAAWSGAEPAVPFSHWAWANIEWPLKQPPPLHVLQDLAAATDSGRLSDIVEIQLGIRKSGRQN